MILRVLLYAQIKLRQISVGVAGEDEVGGFCLHGNEQHLADHGDIRLCRVAGRIGMVVSLVPVALLHGSFAAGCRAGGGTAVVSESTGESGGPPNDAVGVHIFVLFAS